MNNLSQIGGFTDGCWAFIIAIVIIFTACATYIVLTTINYSNNYNACQSQINSLPMQTLQNPSYIPPYNPPVTQPMQPLQPQNPPQTQPMQTLTPTQPAKR